MSIDSTFQSTLMQKLLGRNYKWWYVWLYFFKKATAYRFEITSNIVANIISFLTVFLAWYIAIYSGAKLDFNQIVTYFVIGNIVSVFASMVLEFELSGDINSGKLNNKLLTPSNVFTFFYFKTLGNISFFGPATIIGFVIVSFLFLPYLQSPSSFLNLILTLLLVIIARTIVFYYCILIGSTAFWSVDNSGIIRTFGHLFIFFSGRMFPLDILPITRWFGLVPFSFVFYHPTQIYLGKYDTIQTIWVFVGGIAWCITLYFLAKLVFRLGLKRNESVGL